MDTKARFPKGEPMTLDEVAAVVGEKFKEMNEDPPPSVLKVREKMMDKSATRERLTWLQPTKVAASGDPIWMKAKFPGVDRNGRPFKKGEDIFYYPKTKTVLSGAAAEKAYRDFSSHAFDEDFGYRAAGNGLYGFNKATQQCCEAASRKLSKTALRIAKNAFTKDAEVVSFLQAHVKREGSRSAKVLLAAMRELGPKVASEMRGGMPKEAGAPVYGLYGYKARTAELGLEACKELRVASGQIAADLHQRKSDTYDLITGFLKEHSKQAKCAYSGMILSCYPSAEMKFASSAEPRSVMGWLEWED